MGAKTHANHGRDHLPQGQDPIPFPGASGPFAWMKTGTRTVRTGDAWDVDENVTWNSIKTFGNLRDQYFTVATDPSDSKPVLNIEDPDPLAGMWAYWFAVTCDPKPTGGTARLPAAMRASVVVAAAAGHPAGHYNDHASYEWNNILGTEMNVPDPAPVSTVAFKSLHSSGLIPITPDGTATAPMNFPSGAVSLHVATTGGIRDWDYVATMYLIRLGGFVDFDTLYP